MKEKELKKQQILIDIMNNNDIINSIMNSWYFLEGRGIFTGYNFIEAYREGVRINDIAVKKRGKKVFKGRDTLFFAGIYLITYWEDYERECMLPILYLYWLIKVHEDDKSKAPYLLSAFNSIRKNLNSFEGFEVHEDDEEVLYYIANYIERASKETTDSNYSKEELQSIEELLNYKFTYYDSKEDMILRTANDPTKSKIHYKCLGTILEELRYMAYV